MKQWSAESEDLFTAVRAADSPTADDADRNYQALVGRIGVAAATGVVATATVTATRTAAAAATPTAVVPAAAPSAVVVAKGAAVTMLAKGALAVAVLAGAAAYTAPALRGSAAPAALPAKTVPAIVVTPPRADVERSGGVSVAAGTPPAESLPAASDSLGAAVRATRTVNSLPSRSAARSAAPKEDPTTAATDSAAQLDALTKVRDALRRHDGAGALALIDAYESTYPRGLFVEECAGARVVALCDTGRREQGAVARRAFLAEYPTSSLAPRVRSACDEAHRDEIVTGTGPSHQ